ncbi:MAG: ROK family protein [Lacibacter sp.]
MSPKSKRIGIDIGGSHATASVIDVSIDGTQPLVLRRKDINSFGTANDIFESIGSIINDIVTEEKEIAAVGLAFPGPFDYEKGVSAIAGVGGKFQATFGMHVKQALKTITGLDHLPFAFMNDAHCFAIGAYHRHCLKSKRTVFLTLGTGFGSAFMKDGKLLVSDETIPATGTFYDQPFLEATAEDYVSTRWFLGEYKRRTGETIASVKDLANANTDISNSIFQQFGSNLGAFLLPWLQQFACDEVMIGGNIARANHLFGPAMMKELEAHNAALKITYCHDAEECILTGAAFIAEEEVADNSKDELIKSLRKTTQPLLPLSKKDSADAGYNIYPSYQSAAFVYNGFDSLAAKMVNEKTVVIDGYGGVLWEQFREQLHAELRSLNKKVYWFDVNSCLHTPAKINNMLADALNGDDPVFGTKYNGTLSDFFDAEKLQMLKPEPAADLCIVYGTGAALSNWEGMLVYVDVPKNEIQYRMRAGSITNLGALDTIAHSQMYKRFYFADWPVLNKHKEQLLSTIDCIVDEQRIHEITWMNGEDFRNTLNNITAHPFRARPWFEAGVWGGEWMKKHLTDLNKDEVNYAWSFELISPENGIVIEADGYLMEVSFDFLMYCNNKNILGKAAKRFQNEFPIRFDFLDTYNGGNLSVQCHPRPAYIKEKFGENFTQDETYYILDCEPGAAVYLGFQETIDADEFKSALINAQQNAVELDVEKYVQRKPASKHDLFLIPNGTIHASGVNNLVLEISNTPYIFTFKMYDWQRLDLNGQPRPINIEHAFNNLYFDRKGNYVEEKLISHPVTEAEWDAGRKIKLPTHEEHFFTVDRYEFTGTVEVKTNNHAHVCMLVEGEEVEVTANGKSTVFHYAETFVVPAAAGSYQIKQKGNKPAFVVSAYVKDECC